MPNLFVRGVRDEEELPEIIADTLLKATDDLSFLLPGQLVLLKPAMNSADPYPATCHPESIRTVARVIEEHGGRVVVGDQSGIGHVLHGPNGVVHGSSSRNFEQIMKGYSHTLQFAAFEQDPWESFTHVKAPSWPHGFFVSRWVREADHIITLPRVSTHAQAGVTLGFKNLVGLLREDSRMEFHREGPFYRPMKAFAKGADLRTDYPDHQRFFERIVEIYEAVKDKHRCVLYTATKAQCTIGPDKSMGPGLSSYVVAPKPGIVFASKDIVAAEVFAIAYLKYLSAGIPWHQKLLQTALVAANGHISQLGRMDAYRSRVVAHAVINGYGSSHPSISAVQVPKSMLDAMLS